MPLGFVVEMDRNRGNGVQGFVRRVDAVARQADDVSPAMREIRKSFLAAERQVFASSGGGTWHELNARYRRSKERKGQDPRVERASGELYRALALGRGPGAVSEIDDDGATFGTRLERAVFAQRGQGKRRRRLITVSKRRRTRWVQILRDHINEPIRKP